MKSPSLQKTAAVSAGLHMMFFLLSVLVLRQSHDMVMPSPYIVSLVSPGGSAKKARVEPAVAVKPRAELPAVKKEKSSDRVSEKTEQDLINESLAAIKAKKRLEKLARLKRALISIQGKGTEAAAKPKAVPGAAGPPAQTGEATYSARITGEIHKYWAIPDFFMSENLEAHINVRIGRDGTLFVEGFEKRSGNKLFDKLALRTIEKASPVTPPPDEMEIVIRFTPKEGIQE
jgi:colicin import membrane protein